MSMVSSTDYKSIGKVNKQQFLADVLKAAEEVNKAVSPEDVAQCLSDIVLTSNSFLLVACLFLPLQGWLGLIGSVLFGIHITSRWAIIGHHVSHRAFDKLKDGRYHSTVFGMCWRRFLDWPDWIFPEAWALEHNKNHHCHLNEYSDFDHSDPDLVEMNMDNIIASDCGIPWLNIVWKDLFMVVNMLIWRWSYYASTTYDRMIMSELPSEQRAKLNPDRTVTFFTWMKWVPFSYFGKIFLTVHLPTLLYWGIFCGLFEIVIPGSFYTVLRNVMIGETVANVHSFCIIVPNHCGGDLYKFPNPAKGQADIIFRSVLGSTNYDLGSYWIDFMHGYLNYQIEHHMFPDYSPLHYRLLAPKIKSICQKHGLKYVQENVFMRVFHTRQIIQGFEKMMIYDDRH